MNYLQLNTKNPQLNNVNLRRAISAALDRQALTSKVLQDGSQPAKAFAPKGLATNPTTGKDFTSDAKTPLTYSPTKAKAYLKAALKELHTDSIIAIGGDRKSTRLNSSHIQKSRMPSSA